MWIESMIGFGIQCNTEGLQIDNAGINTKIQSQMDNTKKTFMKIGLTLASKIASGTSCALFSVKWCWLRMWGIDVRPTQEMTWPPRPKACNAYFFSVYPP